MLPSMRRSPLGERQCSLGFSTWILFSMTHADDNPPILAEMRSKLFFFFALDIHIIRNLLLGLNAQSERKPQLGAASQMRLFFTLCFTKLLDISLTCRMRKASCFESFEYLHSSTSNRPGQETVEAWHYALF